MIIFCGSVRNGYLLPSTPTDGVLTWQRIWAIQRNTITGSGGGGTHVYHWSENRALTNRERARLQTFPDDFIFEGSKEAVRKQIGMAVPCKGAQVIYEAILRTFAGIPYESVEPNIDEE